MRRLLTGVFGLLLATNVIATEPASIEFNRACEDGSSIVISAVGDVLLHKTLQQKAVNQNTFSHLWEEIIPFFEKSDFSYANLEAPVARGINRKGKIVSDPGFVYDGKVYSSYPRFNYHPRVLDDLKADGIDLLSTANNHSGDRQSVGINKTVEALQEARIPFVGTRMRRYFFKENLKDWYKVTDIQGIKVTWVSCTAVMNRAFDDDHDQVLTCFGRKGKKRIADIIDKMKKESDAVIILPHWGDEYTIIPDDYSKRYARKWIERGALAVIGSHPHVIQPAKKIKTRDGREGFVIFSLGNFVSNQGGDVQSCDEKSDKKECLVKKIRQRSTVSLFLGLTKNQKGTFINGVRFLPMRMIYQNDTERVKLSLIDKTYAQSLDDLELMKEEEEQSPETFGFGRTELSHLSKVLPASNMIFPREELTTNPQCF